MHLIDLFGIIGGFCFAYCGVLPAIAAIRGGKSTGTPISVAWLIAVGAVAMYAYLFTQYGFNWLLTINYAVEATSWSTVVYYHYCPRRSPTIAARAPGS